jgi:hypothetical protein
MYRPFQFHKRSQLFIGSDNETVSVAAMRANNPDGSPFGIDGSDPAQAPALQSLSAMISQYFIRPTPH